MNYSEDKKVNITAWAEEDRPREKLLLKGKSALSNAELIAILIGSGSRNETAVDLSKRILNYTENNLNNLARLSLSELQEFHGIGEAKAISIQAALEIGARKRAMTAHQRKKITSSADVNELFHEDLASLSHEEFHVLLLNQANKILKRVLISKGGMSSTLADPKVIFEAGLAAKASSIVLIHNHPSGNLKPSQSDMRLTKKLKAGGEVLDLPVIDHLIIAETGYFSFADEGIL
ncbi:MAG: DNA repair protein RadC [Flavobacteriales bacterium]